MSEFVTKKTNDGNTRHLPVARKCLTCQYKKNNVCTITGVKVLDVNIKPDWCPTRQITGYLRKAVTPCVNCKYNKFNYKEMPQECKECYDKDKRNKEYYSELPVFKGREEQG